MPRGYREIAAALRAAIENGDYQPGSRIPTEHDLAQQYAVSRETIRRALAVLKSAGLLTTATSQGTTVSRPPVRLFVTRYAAVADPDRPQADLGPWETACAQQGISGRTEVLAVQRVQASPPLAARLHVPEGAELVHRARRMWADDEVAQVQDSWMPAAVVEGTPLADHAKVTGGVYAALSAAGVDLAAVTEEVTARVPTGDEQRRMRLGDAVPVLEIWRITRDGDGRVVEVLRTVANARRSALVYDNLPIRIER